LRVVSAGDVRRIREAVYPQKSDAVDRHWHRPRIFARWEDLRDLKEAVQRNGDKPLIPLVKVKKDLDLD